MITDFATKFARWLSCTDPDVCWPWTGYIRQNGYGQFMFDHKPYPAHRAALIIATGSNQPGMDACHRCSNRACVNPAHLFWGTRSENIKMSWAKPRTHYNSAKTHCPQGHPYEEENTYRYGTSRICRTCAIIRGGGQPHA